MRHSPRQVSPPANGRVIAAAELLLACFGGAPRRTWQDAVTCVGEIDRRAQATPDSCVRLPPPGGLWSGGRVGLTGHRGAPPTRATPDAELQEVCRTDVCKESLRCENEWPSWPWSAKASEPVSFGPPLGQIPCHSWLLGPYTVQVSRAADEHGAAGECRCRHRFFAQSCIADADELPGCPKDMHRAAVVHCVDAASREYR